MKKFYPTVFFAATGSLLLFNTTFAGPFSISVGIPQKHTFTEKFDHEKGLETGSSSGFFLGFKFPIGIGLGMDRYETKIDHTSSKLYTNIYNIFFQFPIPLLNLTIGLGSGKTKLDCSSCAEDNTGEDDKKENYRSGTANQWYTSLGLQLSSLLDIHFSYRSVKSKMIEQVSSGEKVDFSGTVKGIGVMFNF